MSKTKAQKQQTINDLKDSLAKARGFIFADIQGLKAKELVDLRRKVKQARGQLKVAKKTLIDLAMAKGNETGVKNMSGEVAVLFTLEEPLNPLKVLYNFSKENDKLKLIAGVIDNILVGKEDLLAMAQLPSKEELLARLAGSLNAPISDFVNVLQGNLKGLVYLLSLIANQRFASRGV